MFGVVIKGSSSFVRDVEQALRLLSQTRSFYSDFLNTVACVKHSRLCRFDACMKISHGKGTICIRRGSEFSNSRLSLVLCHEAQHNLLFHKYIVRYGRLAGHNYYKNLCEIERQCVEHEISIGEELGLDDEELAPSRAYLAVLPHPFYLKEQLKCISGIRKVLSRHSRSAQ